jgi:hypothetical protein
MSNITAATAVRRSPTRIIVLAAALVAAFVVAVALMANPLNRPQPAVRTAAASNPVVTPAVAPSPTSVPSVAPGVAPAAAPVVPAESFVCASSVFNNTKAPLSAYVDALRTGRHPGYDRLTIEFQNGQPGTIELTPQSGTTFVGSPRGDKVTLAGRNGIGILIKNSADAHTAYSGPTDIKTGFASLVEVRQIQDFEGYVGYALGVSGPACYHAFILANPSRLVVDIQTS